MALSRSQVEQARHEIELALKQVSASLKAKGCDISLALGRITFNAEGMRGKMTGTMRNAVAPGVATVTPEAAALTNAAWMLRPAGAANAVDLTKSYRGTNGIGTFKFVGYKRQAKKYPFIVQTAFGKRYKITTFSAKQYVAAGVVA